jgi:predicted CXXCH cytochrome family protein
VGLARPSLSQPGMKRTIATLAAAAALLASSPARAALSRDTGGEGACVLASVARETATARLCLSCHDGTFGTAHLAARAGSAAGPGVHPVDVSYDLAAARRRLRPRHEVSRRLVMPDGRVTCVTCHDGASPERYHLALTMSQSAMCQSCHAK